MTENELEWTKIFAHVPLTIRRARTTKCTCGGKNCQTAKRIKCACRCHSENHGAANRQGMSPLDEPLGLDKTDTETLGSLPEVLRLDPEIARELIYIG